MAYTLVLNDGLVDVVLPNGNRYQGGETAILDDEDYGVIPSATSTLIFASVSFTGGGGASDPSVFSIVKHGAKGDGQLSTDGAISTGTRDLVCASGPFKPTDVGKQVMIQGAGTVGVTSFSTVISQYIDATHVKTAANAVSTVSGALVMWGEDDTAAIQAAIDAAVAFAEVHGGAATVLIPAPAEMYYVVAGALRTGGTTLGNAQLTLPPIAVAGNKITITLKGIGSGSGVQHWLQQVPTFSGSTLVSFGVNQSIGAQSAAITNDGNPCVIGGPAQPHGYGTSALLFSNMMVVLEDLSILTAYSTLGLTYSAFDFSGLSCAGLKSIAFGTNGTVPSGEFMTPASLSAGQSAAGLMPANGNNDNCYVSDVTIYGGHTYGLMATEHTVINDIRLLYCWSGLVVVGNYLGSAGAGHGVSVQQASIEGCINEIQFMGVGAAGIGPDLVIGQLDTESSAPNIHGTQTGLAAATGTVRIAGLYDRDNVSTTFPCGVLLIDSQNAFPQRTVTAAYTVGPIDDTIFIDASAGDVVVTLPSAVACPRAYTIQRIDSSAHVATVAAAGGQTINGVASKTLASQYDALTARPRQGNWISR